MNLLQEDKARIHQAQRVTEWLRQQETSFSHRDWLSQSSGLFEVFLRCAEGLCMLVPLSIKEIGEKLIQQRDALLYLFGAR